MMFNNQTEWDKMAKMEYIIETLNDTSIHCNRFPNWEELNEETKNKYRSEVLKG